MQFNIGDRVGDYEIVQVLGAGGMGKVYKVRNIISDRMEAMKVLLPDLHGDPELADRFLREIKVQASLTHPNIAGLHTAINIENQLLMVMEFIEGVSLEKLMERGRMPLEQALDYTMQVLQALGYAHARGVIHRDIKPANMMVTSEGIVKLMDFGIAKMRAEKRLTQTGRTVGSLFYMSPEQIRGDRELDARADLYSLGITLYEVTTGKRPFEGTSDFSLMAAHMQQTPVPPIEVDPALPPHLNEIILMAIAKDPAGRFQSADAFRNALSNVRVSVQGAVTQKPVAMAPAPSLPRVPASPPLTPPPPPSQVQAQPKSNRGIYMALGSLVTVGVLIVAALQFPKWFGTHADSSQQPATVVQQAPPTQAPATDPKPAQPVATEPQPQEAQKANATAVETTQKPQPAVTKSAPPVQAPNQPPVQQQVQQQQLQQQPIQQPVQQSTQQAPQQSPTPTQAPPPPVQQKQAPAQVQQQVPAVNTAAIEAVREDMMKLAARVGAVQSKAKRIEAQQHSQGLGMRSDVVSGISRMTYFMDETENALRTGNAAAAKAALQKADRETETVERILGII